MKDSGDNNFSAGPITEVELSAEDLLDLSPPKKVEFTQNRPQIVVVKPIAASPAAARIIPPSLLQRLLTPRIAGALALAIVPVIAVGSLYRYVPAKRVPEPIVSTWSPLPEPLSASVPEPEPTLFPNPFDPSEVFELPPGTSHDEARAIVADLLVKRATERQAHLDTVHTRRR